MICGWTQTSSSELLLEAEKNNIVDGLQTFYLYHTFIRQMLQVLATNRVIFPFEEEMGSG